MVNYAVVVPQISANYRRSASLPTVSQCSFGWTEGAPLVMTKELPTGARWKIWLNLSGFASPSVCVECTLFSEDCLIRNTCKLCITA